MIFVMVDGEIFPYIEAEPKSSTEAFTQEWVDIISHLLKYIALSYYAVLPLQLIVGFIVCVLLCEFIKPTEYMEIKEIIY